MRYLGIQAEFAARVEEWDKLEGYVRDAIIRDALHRLTEFRQAWTNPSSKEVQTELFVQNYIGTVESMTFGMRDPLPTDMEIWTQWGNTLRMLEVDW